MLGNLRKSESQPPVAVVFVALRAQTAHGKMEAIVLVNRVGRSLSLAAAIAAGTLWASPSSALVTEPDGSVVPIDSGGEVQLYTLFTNRGESIDWRQDAVTVPETFSPLCDFSAEFLLREAGGQSPLGWYNVDPNATAGPPANLIYEIVACNTPPGAVIASQDIKSHPAYAGGAIGFALANGSGCVSFANVFSVSQIHYTESRFNAKYLNNVAAPWFMDLVYDSKVEQNAFYVAFEDGSANAFSFDNDGDFNDFVVLLRGLVCTGGGGACNTGQAGICGPGVEVCRNGALSCEGVAPAGTESCDGLDNDCDGAIDNGDLCAEEEVCDRGVCVRRCQGTEFPCSGGLVCTAEGYCVVQECATVFCPAGEICIGGSCKAPCDDVVCPHGQVCRFGACVNPCEGISCDPSEACVEGVCRPLCACAPCASPLECDAGSGLCVPLGCSGMNCPAGTHCEENAGCVDDCAGASCPSVQACIEGNCLEDAGGSAGGGGGNSGGDTGGGAIDLGQAGDGGSTSGSGDANGLAPTTQGQVTPGGGGGCGCRVAARTKGATPFLLALLVGAAAMSRRRPRRRN